MSRWNSNTIEHELRELVQARRGVMLSAYVDCITPIRCRCQRGHEWSIKPGYIKQGRWCRRCAAEQNAKISRHTIKKMQKIATSHGGRCLSTEYVRAHSHLEWECSSGHHWSATPAHVLAGHWCRRCATLRNAEKARKSIEEMRELAAHHRGKCLSVSYGSMRSLLLWECEEGHRWRAQGASIKAGHWCKKCAIKKMVSERSYNKSLGIEYFQVLATQRGGRCLSKHYESSTGKLTFECAAKHIFSTRAGNVSLGHWCPHCAVQERGAKRRMPIHEVQELAFSRGGWCLSPAYDDGRQKLRWKCAHGHTWSAALWGIKVGQWCPDCGSGLGERLCRAFFEQLFDCRFPSAWPEWLRNERGRITQLDGYCPERRLAFEHHGRQHYQKTRIFSTTDADLEKRQADDAAKRRACTEHGIVLFEIPEIPNLLPVNQVRATIKELCLKYEVPLPANFDTRPVDLKMAYTAGKYRRFRKKMPDMTKGRLTQGIFNLPMAE